MKSSGQRATKRERIQKSVEWATRDEKETKKTGNLALNAGGNRNGTDEKENKKGNMVRKKKG